MVNDWRIIVKKSILERVIPAFEAFPDSFKNTMIIHQI